MKKRMILGTMMLLILAVSVACNNNPDYSDDRIFCDVRINFDVQIVRHGRVEAFESTFNPIVTVVSSKHELEQYYEFACPYQYYNVGHYPCAFWKAIAEYCETFFAENYLVFVMLHEGSGSVRHEVERVEGSGDIIISRLMPDGPVTADIAIWNIVIELNKHFQPAQFNIVFVDKIVSE